MIPVILSGGSGSRLWPLSRKQFPKQFLALTGEHTLFQQTLERLVFDGMDKPIVVCNKDHRFIVNEQLQKLKLETQGILMEPFGRNTAPAVALTAMKLVNEGRDDLMLVLPADHVIKDGAAFNAAIARAAALVGDGALATFGIVPQGPETGYGYIRRGAAVAGTDDGYQVERFVEKPDRATAESFLADGNYYWNSGMFLFRADRYLSELKEFNPDMAEAAASALRTGYSDLDFCRLDEATWNSCPSDSIDYAVMERTTHGVSAVERRTVCRDGHDQSNALSLGCANISRSSGLNG